MDKKKFLVIDGNSIMNRAFYGLLKVNMTSSVLNIHTNALFGFLNIYFMIIEKYTPDYVVVTFDLKAPTFRHKMYEEYKATRHAMPEELKEQMPVIKEILGKMNVEIMEKEGYEADDLIGTIAKQNEKNNIYTYILTGDRDSYQLISDTTSVIMTSTKQGKTEYTEYTLATLKEKYGISALQVIEVKALMGDSADNIPGVKGVGEKTAYSLIQKYDSIQYIYDNIDALDITEKLKEKLLNDKETAFLSHTLATIDTNSPINLDYNKAMLKEMNKEAIYSLFADLEFKSFIQKLDFSDIDTSKFEIKKDASIDTSVDNIVILNNENFSKHLDTLERLFSGNELPYIFNINSRYISSNIKITKKDFIAFLDVTKNSVYILDINNISQELLKDFIIKFAISPAYKIGYNIKQDILYIFSNYIDSVKNFNYDLMIAYYLLNSNSSKYSIDSILYKLFNLEFVFEDNKKENVQLSFFDDEKKEEFLSDTNIQNVISYLKGIYFSYSIMMQKLKDNDMEKLFLDIEMPLSETLAYMENNGMYIDKERLNEYDKIITENLKIIEEEIYTIAKERFNINSTQQLGSILFEKLGLPTVKKTKTGYSTDKDVLEKLEDKHEIIPKLLEYRQLNKLKTTYVDSLRGKIDIKDNRIHTTFMQTVASTGRLSSVEPNLQNIPIKLELGRKIRNFFVGENDNLIMDADYSQIELRVLAHIADDPVMINSFKDGIDIHKTTASQVFDVPINDVTQKMRSHAKAVNFGIVYGISGYGLAQNIATTTKKASEYIEKYLEKYSKIHEFMNDIVDEAKKDGYVKTLFNRRRYIPELKEKNRNIYEFGKRIAMNTPIQGTAADIIKIAMNRIYKRLKENNLNSKLVMQVHDELIIESVPSEVEIVSQILKYEMENVIKLKVPLDVDLKVAKTWYEAH